MALVERGAAPLGIVYATDARASKAVRVVGSFPAASHPPIRYPVALLKASRHTDAAAFRAFLLSKPVSAIFARHGFSLPCCLSTTIGGSPSGSFRSGASR